MPIQGGPLELTDATLEALNLQLVRVTYSKHVIVPSVWLPTGFSPQIYPAHEFGIVTDMRYLLVRIEEIPEIEAQVDSLEKDVPIPTHSVLKVEKHGDRSYFILEVKTKFDTETKQTPTRCNLTTRALEILKRLPRVAAIC